MKLHRLMFACFVVTSISFVALVAAVLIYATQLAPTAGLPLPLLADKVLLKIDRQFPTIGGFLRNELGITRDNKSDALDPLNDFQPKR